MRVLLDTRFHRRQLLRRRLGLAGRLPFGHRHAVDQLARRILVARETAIADPVGEAIATETSQAHQLDVLRVVSMAQVTYQPPESGCGDRIVKRVESIRRIRIHCDYSLSCNEAVP